MTTARTTGLPMTGIVLKSAMLGFIAFSLAACAPNAPTPPPPPPPAPAVAVSQTVTDTAAVYVAYVNQARNLSPDFSDPQTIQAKLQLGATYEPKQLARGAVAYAAIVAMQDPDFRNSLRNVAADTAARTDVINSLYASSNYATKLPNADGAARRVIAALASDGHDMFEAGARVKQAAYDVQRQPWSREFVNGRDERLTRTKLNSSTLVSVNHDDSTRLLTAALNGDSLPVSGSIAATPAATGTPNPAAQPLGTSTEVTTFGISFDRESLYQQPYTPAVSHALAIAALSLLGQGDGQNEALISSLLEDGIGSNCLGLTKLNLYQCLAVAKPNYEDVFCIGQHELMDTGQCLAKISSYALNSQNARQIQADMSVSTTARAYLAPPPKKAAGKAARKKKTS